MPRVRRTRNSYWLATLVGVVGVVLVVVAFDVFDQKVSRAVPLMLLLVPVSIASAIGGSRVSVPLSLAVGVAYCLRFLPPIGRIRIGFTEDMLTLLSFVGVALLVSVLTDVTRSQAADSDRDRAVLLRSVSHDLRSPLGTIRSVSNELRSGGVDDPAARAQLLDLVVDESERLDRIVGNLLSISRIEAGALSPSIEAESIGDIVTTSGRRLERITGGTITLQIEDGLPEVAVDRTQIDQVVTNLIENSLRHGARNGLPADVTVSVERCGSMVQVSVADRGPGFGTDRRERPFEYFQQPGTTSVHGVGLAVCKAIVEAHLGSIRLGDEAGGGARVTFTIPAI